MEKTEMKAVNKPVRKKDAMQLLMGMPVYTDDIAPRDCLIVKLLRSPYPNAEIEEIDLEGCRSKRQAFYLCRANVPGGKPL